MDKTSESIHRSATTEQGAGNPLLDFTGLPRFDQIQPDDVTPAIDELLAEAREVVSRITASDSDATWDSVVEPLNEATDRLARSWGAVSHMNAVVDTPELREQYNVNLPKLTEFWTELSQNEALYEKFKALAAAEDFAQWPEVRRKVVENELRDFRLGGAELAADKKDRFKKIRERESQVSTRFAENVLDATNAFALYVDDASALAGVPRGCLADAVRIGTRRRQDGLQDLTAVSELFRDRRLRARPRAAPTDVPRLFDQGIGIRQSRVEQRPADGRVAEAAARARAAARLQELRRSVAGGENG